MQRFILHNDVKQSDLTEGKEVVPLEKASGVPPLLASSWSQFYSFSFTTGASSVGVDLYHCTHAMQQCLFAILGNCPEQALLVLLFTGKTNQATEG